MAYNCIKHTVEPAVVSCAYCGAGICEDCASSSSYMVGNRPLCPDCNIKVAQAEISRIGKMRRNLLIKSLLIVLVVVGGAFYVSEHLLLVWLLAGFVSAFSAFGSHATTVDHIFHNTMFDADHHRGSNVSTYLRALLTLLLGPLGGLGWLVTNIFQFIKCGQPLKKAYQVLQA